MEDEVVETDTVLGLDRAKAMKRGTFIHQLLQYLPDIEPEKRKEVALRLKPDGIDIPENLFDVFEKEEFNHLFSKESKAEVPIVGVVKNQVVSGQIDRLIITDDAVLIVDFKSGKHVPLREKFVPPLYIKQMMMYKELLKEIFPDKMIKTYLLWTENLSLMELTKHDL
ncbi:MAG: PD-(D/E)XK nuclease family protein [Alphaproteobacteria bacterium]|nr:PD-(D/E)XK nuclease family protein [Alphaproteobacteria bacterium]